MKTPAIEELIVLSNAEIALHEHIDLVKVLGMEESDPGENERYLESGGDYWTDYPDHVKVDGIELDFNLALPYIVVNFDPVRYHDHVELIKTWLGAYREQKDWSTPNPTFYRADRGSEYSEADEAIAFRGGSGYTYGKYLLLSPLTVYSGEEAKAFKKTPEYTRAFRYSDEQLIYGTFNYAAVDVNRLLFHYLNPYLILEFDADAFPIHARLVKDWCEGFRTGKIKRDWHYHMDSARELRAYVEYDHHYFPMEV